MCITNVHDLHCDYFHNVIFSTVEERPLPRAANKAKQLGVQFIDPVEIISCDTRGCDYYNSTMVWDY